MLSQARVGTKSYLLQRLHSNSSKNRLPLKKDADDLCERDVSFQCTYFCTCNKLKEKTFFQQLDEKN